MNPFTMEVEYIDAETDEMVTETIVIDDAEYHPAEPFQPEPTIDSEYPW